MRLIFLFGLVLVLGLTACGGGDDYAETTKLPADKPASESPAVTEKDVPSEPVGPLLARSLAKDPGPTTEIGVIKTNHGDITVRFFLHQAPVTVANFKGLAVKGAYDGVIFHRVMKGFMIQGGDPRGTGSGGTSLWGKKFEDETVPNLTFNRPGLLAMANSGPNTNSSQFFITEVPTPHLDDKHTIFGEVIEGMDVVLAIANVEVGKGSKPVTPVVMETVEIREQ